MKRLVPLAALALAGCAIVPRSEGPQRLFWSRLWTLCGHSYAGRVVSADPADREMAASRLVIHVSTCTPEAVRIAFHVGADRSRTWVIGRTATGLRLRHDHRHRDGSEDVRSRYGGDTVSTGSARRQEFPADRFSRDLFIRENIPASATNVWAIEIAPGRSLAYALDRADRHFRIEFDLSRPVAAPPPAWGAR
ncbi:MAG: hypothetical protein QOD42_1608 [Sphingomonadales bacterium]|jgi:hypothetical protein|nr:hypothetical protein [Sphingomonadales bacterium]